MAGRAATVDRTDVGCLTRLAADSPARDPLFRGMLADALRDADQWTWGRVLGLVVAHPAAAAMRLLAADWLDEHGDAAAACRGRAGRAGCDRPDCDCDAGGRFSPRRDRARFIRASLAAELVSLPRLVEAAPGPGSDFRPDRMRFQVEVRAGGEWATHPLRPGDVVDVRVVQPESPRHTCLLHNVVVHDVSPIAPRPEDVRRGRLRVEVDARQIGEGGDTRASRAWAVAEWAWAERYVAAGRYADWMPVAGTAHAATLCGGFFDTLALPAGDWLRRADDWVGADPVDPAVPAELAHPLRRVSLAPSGDGLTPWPVEADVVFSARVVRLRVRDHAARPRGPAPPYDLSLDDVMARSGVRHAAGYTPLGETLGRGCQAAVVDHGGRAVAAHCRHHWPAIEFTLLYQRPADPGPVAPVRLAPWGPIGPSSPPPESD